MNAADLLEQFVIEARECLESIGTRLLEVERDPANAALLNDLFRSVHTLKGNCGLFEFKALERVVHAGEDLLDRVRNGSLAYSPTLADALLEAMDFSGQLIDQIEQRGQIDASAEPASLTHAKALRALLPGAATSAANPATSPVAAPSASTLAPTAPPDWLTRVEPSLLQANPSATALRYTPEEGCFFKGEDPWRLACITPGLLSIDVRPATAWPTGDALAQWDCYQCALDIVLLSSATRAELDEHYRCVPEQVLMLERKAAATPAAGAQPEPQAPPVHARAQALWRDQLAVLAYPEVVPGAVQACRRALRHLLAWVLGEGGSTALAELEALPDDVSATALLAWAQAQGPSAVQHEAAPAAPEAPSLATAPPAPPATPDAAPDATRRTEDPGSGQGPKVLKVGQEKVDRLMDLIGEMVVAKNSLPYLAQRAEQVFQQRELAREIKAQYTVINRIAEDMQHAIMQVRMLPVGAIFQRFGRLVRDISKRLGKDVQLVVEGEDTEADKQVIEQLADPLIHILRNSLDHGIEQPAVRRAAHKPASGTIRIKARQEGDRVLIDISDDGAGVNPERVRSKAVERGLLSAERAATLSDADAVQLIFAPGFSTADSISDLSGRGVGMDVVRTAVERISGTVTLSSVQGQGTTISLSLPLSMAVTNVMVIASAERRFGIPMDLIVETVRVPECDVHHFKQARTTVLRGRVVPLLALNELLALDVPPLTNAQGELAVLVVRVGGDSVGLIVDHFHGASDIILKPLEGVLSGLSGFAGTALMGDGGVLMILDPKALLCGP